MVFDAEGIIQCLGGATLVAASPSTATGSRAQERGPSSRTATGSRIDSDVQGLEYRRCYVREDLSASSNGSIAPPISSTGAKLDAGEARCNRDELPVARGHARTRRHAPRARPIDGESADRHPREKIGCARAEVRAAAE